MSDLGKKRIIKSGKYYYPQICVIKKEGLFGIKKEEWAHYSNDGHPIYSWKPLNFPVVPAVFQTQEQAINFFKEIEPEEVYEV